MSGTMVVIKVDGTETHHPWYKRTPPDYPTLQSHVGGPVEIVKCRYGGRVRDMYIDENGTLNKREKNDKATALIRLYYGPETVQIVGTVLIWVPITVKL